MDADWVEVRSCSWLHEAELLTSVLSAAGIESRIPNEYTLGVQPGYAAAMGGVKIFVRVEDLERATEVLDSTAAMPADPENADGSE
ncbi:MAG TPA: DUF2007 domain-containing protein [Vicinamibacterales bacterium]|nr:DUF2007 domain-containing protein [Vicinamibacterales bacterium]